MHNDLLATSGVPYRCAHMKDEQGFPCKKTTGGPRPTSMYLDQTSPHKPKLSHGNPKLIIEKL